MKTATAQIKERPILFSGEMVKAILDGRKTQTRRVVNPQPEWDSEVTKTLCDPMSGPFVWPIGGLGQQCGAPITKMKYGKPGDRLWVRETFCSFSNGSGYFYKATGRPKDYEKGGQFTWSGTPWKPSIFMPRAASRINLEIVEVRVERLNEISEADARAEGYEYKQLHAMHEEAAGMSLMTMPNDSRLWFRTLWDKINGKKHPWSDNPWVWVVEFKKV